MVVAAGVNYGSATGDLRSPDVLVVSLTATRELVTQQDSVGARRAAERAVSDFLDRWRAAWLRSDSASGIGSLGAREAYMHCDVHEGRFEAASKGMHVNATVVTAAPHGFARCPSWRLASVPHDREEADRIDDALSPAERPAIRGLRAATLDSLARAQQQIPSDPWILSQRVRLLVDHGNYGPADSLSRACRIAWLCPALAGYVLAQRREWRAADSTFTVATNQLPLSLRCDWLDIAPLLTPSARAEYLAMDCVQRLAHSERYWWLADPLYSEGGNPRRAAHLHRQVLLLLRSGLPADEHFRWRREEGSETMREVVLRYGWPSAAIWLGKGEDRSHDAYLRVRNTPSARPYTTLEYSGPRVRLAPTWESVKTPSAVMNASWQFGPRSGEQMTGARNPWSPEEHMYLGGGTSALLDEGQSGFVRRGADTHLIAAVEVPRKFGETPIPDGPATIRLVASAGPDRGGAVAEAESDVPGRIALEGVVPDTGAMLIGVELVAAHDDGLRARSRFAVVSPGPLAGLSAGDVAMSDLFLFAPPTAGALPASLDELLSVLSPSVTVARGSPIGIFWETYGLARGDSVDIAVELSRMAGNSLLQRVGSGLRLTARAGPGVSLGWSEIPTQGSGTAGVGIWSRSVVLDSRELDPGAYWVTVETRRPGRNPVRHRRLLTIG